MGAILALTACLSILPSYSCGQSADTVLIEDFSIGSFQRARRIDVRQDGSVYVIDSDGNMVYQYLNLSDPPRVLGGFGWGTTTFDKPTGISTDGVNIYISDYGNHRIQRFDRYFNYISSLSTRDTSDALLRFGYPLDVAISELGDLFLIDGENIRILKFNQMFFLERSFGDINAGRGRLQNPVKLLVTASRIYVGERTRIVTYDYFGNYIGEIGKGIISDLNGFSVFADEYMAASKDTIWWFSQNGALKKTIPLSSLISGEPIEQIQDIDCKYKKIFILSAKRIHIYEIKY
jgi:hypothetical protein